MIYIIHPSLWNSGYHASGDNLVSSPFLPENIKSQAHFGRTVHLFLIFNTSKIYHDLYKTMLPASYLLIMLISH